MCLQPKQVQVGSFFRGVERVPNTGYRFQREGFHWGKRVLLLAHPLAAFFDQRTHKTGDAIGFVGKKENPLP